MRFPKTLVLIAFVAAIVLSVIYGKQQEGFQSGGGLNGGAIALIVLGSIGIFVMLYFGLRD